MSKRPLMAAAVFSSVLISAYALWLKVEETRAQQAAWATVTDPVD